jgi:hypothetical protein
MFFLQTMMLSENEKNGMHVKKQIEKNIDKPN